MNKPEKHTITDQTLIRFIEKETSIEENELIKSWLFKQNNRDHFDKLKKLWKHSDAINDFDLIDTAKDWKNVKLKIENLEATPTIKKLNSFTIFMRIAAILIVLVGITLLIRYYIFSPPEMIAVSTGLNQSEIVLPDDSRVYLNENSTITYPEKFTKKEKAVNLIGEAYFEVNRDEKRSFKIHTTNNSVVEVLGTSFNVNADTTSSEVIVHVTSGKVAFYKTNDQDNKTILINNETAILDHDTISKSVIENPNFLSWKTGVLEFKNSSLATVVDKLTDFYKQTIILLDQSTLEYKYTSIIDNQPLDEVLEEITLVFNLEFATRNDTIFIIPNQ